MKAVGNATSTWAGNVELNATAAVARPGWFSVGADGTSTLVIDGLMYGAGSTNLFEIAQWVAKVGSGTVEYRGISSASLNLGGTVSTVTTYYGQTCRQHRHAGPQQARHRHRRAVCRRRHGRRRQCQRRQVRHDGRPRPRLPTRTSYVTDSGNLDTSAAQNYTPEVQLLTFPANAVNGSTFQLSLPIGTAGATVTTAPITYSSTAATTATNIQNALQAAAGTGGVFPGSFTVTSVDAAALNYQIVFGGTMANAGLPAFTASGAAPPRCCPWRRWSAPAWATRCRR